MVRGGIATPQQLQAGTTKHRGVPEPPGLYGFSVQYQPGKTVTALAVAGKFRHARISVTTDDALRAAGVSAGCVVWLVRSPGGGYHHTMHVPFPFPWELAEALRAVFTQMANPARSLDTYMEESRMGIRIYVDFNTTTIDAKERVAIPTQMQPALAHALRPGMVVTLYDEEMEVRATIEFDAHDQVWLGQPH